MPAAICDSHIIHIYYHKTFTSKENSIWEFSAKQFSCCFRIRWDSQENLNILINFWRNLGDLKKWIFFFLKISVQNVTCRN